MKAKILVVVVDLGMFLISMTNANCTINGIVLEIEGKGIRYNEKA